MSECRLGGISQSTNSQRKRERKVPYRKHLVANSEVPSSAGQEPPCSLLGRVLREVLRLLVNNVQIGQG